MSRVTINRADGPGTPSSWYREDKGDGCTVLVVVCSNGHESSLRHNLGHGSGNRHTIDAGGVVSPSVVCPRAGCAFHEWVQLGDWDGVIPEPKKESGT